MGPTEGNRLEDDEVKSDIHQGKTDEGGEIVVEFIRSFIATGFKR